MDCLFESGEIKKKIFDFLFKEYLNTTQITNGFDIQNFKFLTFSTLRQSSMEIKMEATVIEIIFVSI